ncbi:MAG: glycosyltransferase family 4 protein [Proteobacteria bacterium]|nr:glycosyltransferase family 4 protein [Pseudomonadota bacterium]
MSFPTILQVLPSLETGGVEQTTLDIAEALLKKGVRALVASQGGRLREPLEKLGALHFDLSLKSKNPWKIWRNSKILFNLVKEEKVSLIHARSRAPAWSAYRAAQQACIPFVTTFHGTYNTSGLFKKEYNRIMTKGEVVIANSKFIGQHINSFYKTPFDKIRIIPRGVDLSVFDPQKISEAQKQTLRKEMGLPQETGYPLLILPGRLTSWKGQMMFLEALHNLKTKNYFALLVGDDQGRHEYRQQLEYFIMEKNLSDHVKIVGHRSDMPLVLSLADIVISASTDPEAFGRIMIEAFAMVKPVVAPDHGGALEIVQDQINGFFFKARDTESLTEVLNVMLSLNKSERMKLGEAGRSRVETEFAKDIMCARTLDIYKEVLNEKNFSY